MTTAAELGRGLCYSIFVQTTIENIQWRLNPFNPLWVYASALILKWLWRERNLILSLTGRTVPVHYYE